LDIGAGEVMHDWDIIAARDPFFGVLSSDEYRADRIDAEAIRRFYETGEQDIQRVLEWFDTDLGAGPTQGTALDIGCGVGRLSHAMARVMPGVVGYDVSEVMLRIARDTAPANLTLTHALPSGPFDWINSYIVFQHIPPTEGLELLANCLDQAAPKAFLSVQLTGWRDGPPPPPDSLRTRFQIWRRLQRHRKAGQSAEHLIQMYDYNFSAVLRVITERGFSRIVLRHTAHGRHHGAWFLAQRD
jgi:SAM-dependent methyltransferase